jgi:hypothetical protein
MRSIRTNNTRFLFLVSTVPCQNVRITRPQPDCSHHHVEHLVMPPRPSDDVCIDVFAVVPSHDELSLVTITDS